LHRVYLMIWRDLKTFSFSAVLAKRIESIIGQLEPRPGLLVIIEYEHIEVYDKH